MSTRRAVVALGRFEGFSEDYVAETASAETGAEMGATPPIGTSKRGTDLLATGTPGTSRELRERGEERASLEYRLLPARLGDSSQGRVVCDRERRQLDLWAALSDQSLGAFTCQRRPSGKTFQLRLAGDVLFVFKLARFRAVSPLSTAEVGGLAGLAGANLPVFV